MLVQQNCVRHLVERMRKGRWIVKKRVQLFDSLALLALSWKTFHKANVNQSYRTNDAPLIAEETPLEMHAAREAKHQ